MLKPIDEFLRLRREQGGASLRNQIVSPMLAIFGPNIERPKDFKTATVSIEVARRAGQLAQATVQLGANAEGGFAAPVAKMSDSPWGNRISVGRARNNDICIPDGSLSKLHAHIITTDDGGYAVSDTGSKNGTRVNKELTKPGEPYPLAFGDLIHIGGVVAVFHSPESFLRFLQLLDVSLERTEQAQQKRAEREERERAESEASSS